MLRRITKLDCPGTVTLGRKTWRCMITSDWKSQNRPRDKFYESLIHHPFLKPPIARAQLLSGIHNACRSYDNNDKAAAYKTTLQKHNAVGSDWTQIVELSGNMSWINQLVRFRINNIRKTWSHSFHL